MKVSQLSYQYSTSKSALLFGCGAVDPAICPNFNKLLVLGMFYVGFIGGLISLLPQKSLVHYLSSCQGTNNFGTLYLPFLQIVALLLLNATISFVEESNADKAIKALAGALAPKCKVEWKHRPSLEKCVGVDCWRSSFPAFTGSVL